MAGIIVSLGNDTTNKVKIINNKVQSCKGLNNYNYFESKKCNIIKYRRNNNLTDNYWYETDEVVLCIVGTLIYKEYNIEESIKKMGMALSHGAPISKIINNIDGHYFLVAVLKNSNQIYLITDVGGVINSYLIKKNGSYYVSTSMLSLSQAFNVTADSKSILTFIHTGTFFENKTYFNEIIALEPASIYTYDIIKGLFQREEYWHVPVDIDKTISFEDAADGILKSLNKIISTIPDDKSIYDFTGGYDSRFILALAYSKKNKGNLNSLFFGPRDSREAQIVEKNCKNLGIEYNNYLIDNHWKNIFFDYVLKANNLCDGLESAFYYAPILWAQEQKVEKFAYSVNGLVGELYRQRVWEYEFGRRGKRRPADLLRYYKYRDLTDDFDKTIFDENALKIINDVPNFVVKNFMKSDMYSRTKNSLNTLQLEAFFLYLSRRRHGRNVTTSNQFIQVICPFWFRRPLDLSFAINPDFKKKCRLMRNIMEKISPEFAREKMIAGTPFVEMKFKNFYLFLPGVLFFIKKLIRKLTQIFFNKTIWAGLTIPDYNKDEWFRFALKDHRCIKLLDWKNMRTKKLYNENMLNKFVEKAIKENFHFYGQLGNIITAELVLRNSKVDVIILED